MDPGRPLAFRVLRGAGKGAGRRALVINEGLLLCAQRAGIATDCVHCTDLHEGACIVSERGLEGFDSNLAGGHTIRDSRRPEGTAAAMWEGAVWEVTRRGSHKLVFHVLSRAARDCRLSLASHTRSVCRRRKRVQVGDLHDNGRLLELVQRGRRRERPLEGVNHIRDDDFGIGREEARRRPHDGHGGAHHARRDRVGDATEREPQGSHPWAWEAGKVGGRNLRNSRPGLG